MGKLEDLIPSLDAKVRSLKPESLEILQSEWRDWFQAYGVALDDDALNVAIVVGSAFCKNYAEITGDAPKLQRRNPVIAKTLDSMVLSTAVLASMRTR